MAELSNFQQLPLHVLTYGAAQDDLAARALEDGESYVLNGGFAYLFTPMQVLAYGEVPTSSFVFSTISVGLDDAEAPSSGYVLFESSPFLTAQAEFWVALNSTVTIQYSNDLENTSPWLETLPEWQSITLITTTETSAQRGTGDTDMMLGVGETVRLYGLDGDDTVFGYTGNDHLHGNRGDDVIYGNDGADVIRGNRGEDTLYGGAGGDKISGGGGSDRVYGEDGDDWLRGGGGEDWLYAGAGDDVLIGGRNADGADGAKDTFVFDLIWSDDSGFDRIRGFEDGVDVIRLSGGPSFDFDTDVMPFVSERDHGVRIDLQTSNGAAQVIFVEGMTLDQFDASDIEIAPFLIF